MSLKILMGASGHGKTYNLYNNIIEESLKPENTGRRYILIVPEQSSLQAQKDIVRMHSNGGVFNIDVLTFGRFAYRIFEELGVELKEIIDDTGKNLIIRKAAEKVEKELKVIKINRKTGMISEIKSMISEFKQYGQTPDKLDEIGVGIANDRLRQKLADINVIYREFESYIEGKFMTVEDRPEELLKVMDKTCFLDNTVVAFDGFTGFTPVQYRTIEKIMEMAEEVIITATIPDDCNYNVITGEEDLFAMSKTMISKLGVIADRLGQKMLCESISTDKDKFRFAKSAELDFLENNLFTYNGQRFEKEVNDINICCMDNFKQEVKYAAAKILDWVRDKELRFRNIAVVTGDMSVYGDEIMRVFTESGIPLFMDYKRSIINNPLVEYIRAAVEVIQENYSYESMFRFLKNRLLGIDCDKVDCLENYVLAFGIRGHLAWNREFEYKYFGKACGLDEINEIRCMAVDALEELYTAFKKPEHLLGEYVKALYAFIEKQNSYEYMEKLADDLEERAGSDMLLKAKAAEYRKIYTHIIRLFEQLDELMGDESVSIEDFAGILDAGFEEIKVGIIPPSVDCVTVGDIERTRLEHIKVMFILGTNEGIIPKLASSKGILSENERKILGEREVELAPAPRDKVFIQNFYLYLNMTEPECSLYITYYKYDTSGKEAKRSRIINMLCRMYPKLEVKKFENLRLSELITNSSNSKHLVSDFLFGESLDDEYILALLAYFMQTEPYASDLKYIIEVYTKTNETDALTKAAASKLYEELQKSSITRIETFAKCAFSHFVQYGLELEERKVYELNSADMGSVFHKAIELLSKNLAKTNKSFADIEEEERRPLVEEAIDEVSADFKAGYFEDNSTNEFLKRRITDILDRTVWALGKQLKTGGFRPEQFEREFNEQFENTRITGKIDRVDMLRRDNNIYVKIVDYKSGNNELGIDDIYAGLKLQLMVYLKSTIDATAKANPDKSVIAAGTFYNRIDNPFVDYNEKDNPEDYEKMLLKELRPTGFVGAESAALMDEWDKGDSLVIPAKRKSTGELPVEKTVFSDSQMKCLADFATSKLANIEKEIFAGSIAVNPYKDSCMYCKFKSICGFDSKDYAAYRKTEHIEGTPDMWKKLGFNGEEETTDGMDEGTE